MAPTILNRHKQNVFLKKVTQTITQYRMFSSGDAVLIGMSGGPDSSALLHALLQLAPRFSLQLGIAHLNHSLRKKAADSDEAFVASRASELDLPFFSKKTDIRAQHAGSGLSLEEVARNIRYDFFSEVIQSTGFTKVALGHHRDDNAELILMNLIRGSGPLGLTGIPPAREHHIVRPLIDSSKQEILAFLSEREIPFVTDTSNDDRRFLRNRVRHQLLPLLASDYNPRIMETLIRLGAILGDEETWADERIEATLADLLTQTPDGQLRLSASGMGKIHVAAKRRLIRTVLRKLTGDLRRMTFGHIEAVLRLSGNIDGDGMLNLPGGVVVERLGDHLQFGRSSDKRPGRQTHAETNRNLIFHLPLFQDGFEPLTLRIEPFDLQIRFSTTRPEEFSNSKPPEQRIVYFDLDRLHFPMILRNARSGDFFQPLGMNGRQKLSKFFSDKKVPRDDRKKCLVLESGGRVIWIVGHRIDDAVKLTGETRQVLKAELLLAG